MGTKRKKGVAPPRYDEAFKVGAVKLVSEQGRPSTEVAKERWVAPNVFAKHFSKVDAA